MSRLLALHWLGCASAPIVTGPTAARTRPGDPPIGHFAMGAILGGLACPTWPALWLTCAHGLFAHQKARGAQN
jgi:hypothetical protein